MKISLIVTGMGLAASLLIVSGCVERRVVYRDRPARVQSAPPGETEIIVTETPPAPRVEVVTVAPGPDHIWLPGFWEWHSGWVWVGGRWEIRPHPRAVWVRESWVHRGHGYVFVRGHWR